MKLCEIWEDMGKELWGDSFEDIKAGELPTFDLDVDFDLPMFNDIEDM